MQAEEQWDIEIKPKSGLLQLNLGELWRYKDLILLFVRRDFVAVYKQTILGPIWFFIQPLLTTLTFVVVFGGFAGISTDGIPPVLFYLAGITLWNYFADCFKITSDTFIANANIFGKVYFPRLAVPLSVVVSNLLKLGIQFMLFLSFYAFFILSGTDISPNLYAFLTPILVLIMAFLGLGFGMIFSSLTTKYRDLRFLLQFGIQLMMYATPVIYPLSSIPEKYKIYLLANPISAVIETFKYGFLGTGTFEWVYLAYSLGFTVIVFFIGLVLFNKIESTFMDTV
ncbi:MAG: ABC transporter permease [Bacteroidota bacterium]